MSEQAGSKQWMGINLGQESTNPINFSLVIGFFAGLIWGLFRWLATGFNFTAVTQAFLLDPFVRRNVLGGFPWQLAGLVAFMVMSILAALIYVIVLGRFKGPWPGACFGIAWWGLFYVGVGPMSGAVPPIRQIGWNSIVTDFCLFLVWGLFIGYSISFEFHSESEREPKKKKIQDSPQTAS